MDPDRKVLRGLDALGPVAGREVVILGEAPLLEARLRELGSVVRVAPAGPTGSWGRATFAATALPAASADVVLAQWIAFDGVADAAELAEVDRLLRPGGRLLVVQDYGRDDLDDVRGAGLVAELLARSRRDGPLLMAGFRVRVVHAFWEFADLDEAARVLRAAFGPAATATIAALRRPRLAHNVAIYHRPRGGVPEADVPAHGTHAPARSRPTASALSGTIVGR